MTEREIDLSDVTLRERARKECPYGFTYDNNHMICPRCEGEASFYIALRDAARREQAERDMRILCFRCERGVPIHWEPKRGQWEHDLIPENPTMLRCDAAAIRAQEVSRHGQGTASSRE